MPISLWVAQSILWIRIGFRSTRGAAKWCLSVALAMVVGDSQLLAQASLLNPPEPKLIHEYCLQYRAAATQAGAITLHSRTQRDIGGPEASETAVQFRIWFNNGKLRIDMCDVDSDGSERGEWERFIVTERTYTWIPAGEFEGVTAPVAEYSQSEGGVIGHFRLFHPRWIGMGVNHESVMEGEPRARLVNPAAQSNVSIIREDVDGHVAWKLTKRLKYPGTDDSSPPIPGEMVYWFAPDAGWSLVRGELRELGSRQTKVMSVQSKLRQFGPSGVWFPEVVVREIRYGNRVTERTTLTITEADFGTPPDPLVFTVAGLGLPAGQRVADRTQGPIETVAISDGRQMVPLSGSALLPAPSPPQSMRAWWLLVNAVVLAIVGVVIALRSFRRQRL